MFHLASWPLVLKDYKKVVNGYDESEMLNATRPVTYSGIPTKRKRSLSEKTTSSFDHEIHNLKLRKDVAALRSPVSPKETKLGDVAKKEATEPTIDSHLLSRTIEAQFSLEILLKHNELRLIDQELAKCQVALEQLRRCHLIPYPNSRATPEVMLNVSNGTGPVVSHTKTAPPWAPPFGVTDGPYTRHYAKWLIPDPNFDGVPWQVGDESRNGEILSEGRATRNSIAEGTARAGKLGLRGTASQKLHALSSGYPQARDKSGPCILKRSDGQTVKLVCLDCDRGNFSSTQGFINHCRIAHQRDYKSHEEAAIACGKAVDFNEAGGIVGYQNGLATSNGLVHPLIRSAPTGKEAIEACKALLSRVADSKAMLHEGRLPGFTSIPTSKSKISHTEKKTRALSSITPNLSELLSRRGFAGDLNEIIVEVQQPVDFEDSQHEDDSDDSVRSSNAQIENLTPESCLNLSQMRMPARVDISSGALGRPECAKMSDGKVSKDEDDKITCCSEASPAVNSAENSEQLETPSYLAQLETINENDVGIEIVNSPTINDICPHIIASNNAPSLVSDDGEYDEDNIDSGRSEDEVDDSDVAEIDFEEEIVHRSVLSDTASTGNEARRLGKEQKEKHVTFVSSIEDSKKGRIKSRRK